MTTDFQKENCVTITKITETTNSDGVRVVRKEHVNPKNGEVLVVETQEYPPENKKDDGFEEVILQEYPPSPRNITVSEIESQPSLATSTILDDGQNNEDDKKDEEDKKKRRIILATVLVVIVLILIIALAVGLGGDDDYEYEYDYEGGGYSNDDSSSSSSYGNSDSSDDNKGKWMYCSVSSSCYNYATGYYESCYKSEYVYRPAGYC